MSRATCEIFSQKYSHSTHTGHLLKGQPKNGQRQQHKIQQGQHIGNQNVDKQQGQHFSIKPMTKQNAQVAKVGG